MIFMKAIVSGLVNIETNVEVKGFPIPYFPIDYPFFGVESSVGGVGYNVAKALSKLGDEVKLLSLVGNDISSKTIINELEECNINTDYIKKELKATPTSVALHDKEGKREIYCDLKDIQEKTYELDCKENPNENADVMILCNINFNRELLKKAKEEGKVIATDVHVLSDVNDEYNKDFLEAADILFLSDENLPCEAELFIKELAEKYPAKIIVIGRGKKGVSFYERGANEGKVQFMEAIDVGEVVNTIGAGDALFSAFIHYYIKGYRVTESIKRAQIFAALKIRFNGASIGFASEEEVEKYM